MLLIRVSRDELMRLAAVADVLRADGHQGAYEFLRDVIERAEERKVDAGEDVSPGPAVVAVGGPLGGYKLYGPFATIQEAADGFEGSLMGQLGEKCTIMPIKPPGSML